MMSVLIFHWRSRFSCLRWIVKHTQWKNRKANFLLFASGHGSIEYCYFFEDLYHLIFRVFCETKFNVRSLGKGIKKCLNKPIFSTQNRPLKDLIHSCSHSHCHKHQHNVFPCGLVSITCVHLWEKVTQLRSLYHAFVALDWRGWFMDRSFIPFRSHQLLVQFSLSRICRLCLQPIFWVG